MKFLFRRTAWFLLDLVGTVLTLAYYLLVSPILLVGLLQNARLAENVRLSNETRAALELAGNLLLVGAASWAFNWLTR